MCGGVFDVLHAGHLAYFRAAKKFGDHLIVAITTDRFVNKGPGRPYFTTMQRAEMVKSLGLVDEVYISDSPTAVKAILDIKPAFYVKGPDYRDSSKDVTGGITEERRAVESYGGQIVFTDDETFSSSTIINKFFQGWSDEQKAFIEKVKDAGGIEAIKKALSRLEKLRVIVVGEPITDIYRFCRPEGISSKSPTISARFQYEEQYKGGSIAIGRHLESFCDCLYDEGGTNVTKIRYISSDRAQRVFEVTYINEEWDWARVAKGIEATNHDAILAADFGHGLFKNEVMEVVDQAKCFVGLNVQTNSSNFGFNVHTKHKRWDYLCLDTREARLAAHDKDADPAVLARRFWQGWVPCAVSLTLGSGGSLIIDKGGQRTRSPAFTDTIVDATGAGDAYFAITSLLVKTDCDAVLTAFIGNVFAGLKTKIIGNKSAVSKANLIKACEGILK